MTSALTLDGVSKRFGTTEAVRQVSMDIAPGEFVALLGASGCGKSTTLRLLAGLEQPDTGRVLLDGRDVTTLSAAARNIALMFQSYALYPHMSVFQNIATPLRLRRLGALHRLPGAPLLSARARATRADIAKEVDAVAGILRLDGLLNRKPGQLSGGQQQRVALARALVRQPTAFLLDEPLSNLDTQLRATTREEIRALHVRTGYPFVLVTHDQSDALSMADRVAVMIAGEIAQMAPPRDLFARPANRAVAEFVGQHRINILPAGVGAALHPAGASLEIGVRPDDLHIDPDGDLRATVAHVTFHGEETIVLLKTEAGQPLRTIFRDRDQLPEAGAEVRLSAPVSALHGFDATGLRRELAA